VSAPDWNLYKDLQRKLSAVEVERNALRARLKLAVSALQFINGQKNLFFAECSQAEQIVSKTGQALAEIGDLPKETAK
jgi:hypothetical protein